MKQPGQTFSDYLIDTLIRFPLGLLVAHLPRRLWPRLDEWAPVTSTTPTMSAIATILLALAIGVVGYLAVYLRSPGRSIPLFAPFDFAFTTPIGMVATYLLFTGIFRVCNALVDNPGGDPMLTAIDSLIVTRRHEAAEHRRRLEREALEGPEVPDRLLEAHAAGFPDADWVVVASRRKPEWTKGTFVVTGEKWYRLHEPVERRLPVGLRTFYPMSAASDLEVARRCVQYELPPLGSVPSGKSMSP